MNQGKMSQSQFAGMDSQTYWRGQEYGKTIKLLAKMFREITHLKPPRGREGRHLDYEGHYAVELVSDAAEDSNFRATQRAVYAGAEIDTIENKGNSYRKEYSCTEPFEDDLGRLARWHEQHQNKLRVENTVNSLQDLIQGLMGLGLTSVDYEPYGFGKTKYTANLTMGDFYITVQEREAR
jgi:hypothetical protein